MIMCTQGRNYSKAFLAAATPIKKFKKGFLKNFAIGFALSCIFEMLVVSRSVFRIVNIYSIVCVFHDANSHARFFVRYDFVYLNLCCIKLVLYCTS